MSGFKKPKYSKIQLQTQKLPKDNNKQDNKTTNVAIFIMVESSE